MDWMNLHIQSTVRSPEYIGSSPTERATWLSVMAYACEIECGGRLAGASDWKCRQWQQACGVTLREVRAATRLLRFDGPDLLVNGYPQAKEKQVRQARGVGKAGAMARWGMPTANGETMPTGMPTANAEGEGEGEGEGARHGERDSLGTWIRTGTRDRAKTKENRAALDGLLQRFGIRQVQTAAEAIVFARGGKIWPDDADLLARLIESTKPVAVPIEALPDDLNTLPDGHPLKPRPRARA